MAPRDPDGYCAPRLVQLQHDRIRLPLLDRVFLQRGHPEYGVRELPVRQRNEERRHHAEMHRHKGSIRAVAKGQQQKPRRLTRREAR